jgi:hypothetical protein
LKEVGNTAAYSTTRLSHGLHSENGSSSNYEQVEVNTARRSFHLTDVGNVDSELHAASIFRVTDIHMMRKPESRMYSLKPKIAKYKKLYNAGKLRRNRSKNARK